MPYPAKKTPKLVNEVLSRIAGGETLAAMGRELDFHPQSWADWIRADEALAIAYQRARDVGADVIADDILRIIDEVPADSEQIQRAKLRAEYRLKLLAKWNPKRYGETRTLEVGNKEGESLKIESGADNVALTLSLASYLALEAPK
tara:strand:+ start:2619 stop:3056 length:438 start_codon:yes stop_codon:yes gene_type:complete